MDTVAAVSTAKKASAALHPQANGEDQDFWEVDKAMGPAGPIGPVEKIEPGGREAVQRLNNSYTRSYETTGPKLVGQLHIDRVFI